MTILKSSSKVVISPEKTRKTHVLSKDVTPDTDTKIDTDAEDTKNELSVETLLATGVVNLNKPMGPTSHQVSGWVKHIFGLSKVGHGGTLDPRVTGVLPLAFGSTTRLLSVFTHFTKEYIGIMRLHRDVNLNQIKRVAQEFVGPIYQLPPLRSAVKRQTRIRTIHSLDIMEQKKRDILFKVVCEPGTYIRTLVNDLGMVLGVGAHMQELRRARTGAFHEKDSVTLHDLKDAAVFWATEHDDTLLRQCVKPMETILEGLPKIIVHDSAVDALCHGAGLAVPGIMKFDDIRTPGELVAIFSRRGEGIAVGEAAMVTKNILKAKSGIAVRLLWVLMPPGTYDKGWKTKDK